MKNYKAVVIDGRKTIKNILRVFLTILFTAVISKLILIFSPIGNAAISMSAEDVINRTVPIIAASNGSLTQYISDAEEKGFLILSFILGFDPRQSDGIINSEFPLTKAVNKTAAARISSFRPQSEQNTEKSDTVLTDKIPPENRGDIKSADLSPKRDDPTKIMIGNETSYSVNIDRMLADKPNIDMNRQGPKVLIIHTHATEAYSPENADIYDISKSERNADKNVNVVHIGDVMCKVFKSKGIDVLHDTELHDYPSFNGSYAHSLAATESYLEKYPSIQFVFDIHRDSIVYDDNTKIKSLTRINGQNAAQLMFVVGTDENGLYNPDWRTRLTTAIHLQDAINRRYPSLMRHINLRKERFNGHAAPGSMIIETGSSGNSLSEAEYGISLAAECIADYINSFVN